MPSVTYMNQSAPFWDFLASLEQQGTQHPLFNQARESGNENDDEREHAESDGPFGPWGWNQFFGGGRGMPYRGPPHQRQEEETTGETSKEKDGDKDAEMRDENDNGEGPSGHSGSDTEGRPHGRGRHGHCGSGRRGRCGPGGPGGFGPRHGPRHGPHFGPPHHGPPHHGPPHHGPPHHGPPHHGHHGGRGPRGFRGRHGPFGGGFGGPFGGFGGLFDPSTSNSNNTFDPSTLLAQLWSQFNDNHPSTTKDTPPTSDHSPDADIFDTPSSYILHISLPGAKKEDVGVNWDAENNEVSIAGVIYRPGSEELLKTLAVDERKVGAFERKIRLGTRASPAHVDAEGITARLEDGVLRVEVPKMDGGFVEIRKVDIE